MLFSVHFYNAFTCSSGSQIPHSPGVFDIVILTGDFLGCHS